MVQTLIAVAIVVLLLPCRAQAQSLCQAPKSGNQSEGHMPIPEEAFTKQAADRELRKLRQLLGPDGLTIDAPVWETSFVYLEGWYLKRQALEAKKRGGPGYPVTD